MIKLIAADMDGTFLRDDLTYDNARFRKIFEKMEENGVKFVAASGNQHSKLRSHFSFNDHISIIAENGAHVLAEKEELVASSIPTSKIAQILALLKRIPRIEILLSGKRFAYTDSKNEKVLSLAKRFFVNLKVIENIKQLPKDQFFKITCLLPSDSKGYMTKVIEKNFGGNICVKAAGHGTLDILSPDINKATGLERLGKKYAIRPSQMIAFGNDWNDEEMLTYAGRSFVPGNADPSIQQLADKIIPSNNSDGVLKTLEDYAANNWEYPY
ncbi:Cof-type HAD-IIB family hydrolase [Candidatus Enterococcus murrayae]|uniref:HAD family hydrolase n=1 Tax=Candidatus Enterococcus murrayae TaxID=2815321 RepID=A0ABS3HFR8_9ENTE|nr:Cof-type HAD-IIB family hydrolase [Enterococcus sp. MJM16]MBO0451862.1 HAD family hydrolase [Enterococcus sp. MJM16]